MKKLSKQQFFSAIAPSALLVYSQGSPIYPSVRIAYCYLKSNGILTAWNNLTQMLVADGRITSYWRGEYVIEHTGQLVEQSEEEVLSTAQRSYRTLYHSFVDEELYYNFKKRRQIKNAESPYLQAKALITAKHEEISMVEHIHSLIEMCQLEYYDRIYTFFDKPAYVLSKNTIPVMYENELIAIAFYVDHLLYISLRKIEKLESVKVEKLNGIVRLNGHIVKAFTIDNLCYVNLEDLKKFLLIQVEWDQYAKVLSLY